MALDRKTRILGTAILAIGVVAVGLRHEPARSAEAGYRSMLSDLALSRRARHVDRMLGTQFSPYFSRRAETRQLELFAAGFLARHTFDFPGGAPPITRLETAMLTAFGENEWWTLALQDQKSIVVMTRASDGAQLREIAAGLGFAAEQKPANRGSGAPIAD